MEYIYKRIPFVYITKEKYPSDVKDPTLKHV